MTTEHSPALWTYCEDTTSILDANGEVIAVMVCQVDAVDTANINGKIMAASAGMFAALRDICNAWEKIAGALVAELEKENA